MSENLMRIWPKLTQKDKNALLAWANNAVYRHPRIHEDELIFMDKRKFLHILAHITQRTTDAPVSQKWVAELRRKLWPRELNEKVHG